MCLIGLGAGNYVLYLLSGKTVFRDLDMPDIPELSLSIPELPTVSRVVSDTMDSDADTVFKWTDDAGVIHYSSEAPEQVQAQVIQLDPDTNLVEATRVQPQMTQNRQANPATDAPSSPSPDWQGRDINKLISDAQNVEKLLQDRYNKQKEIIDSQ